MSLIGRERIAVRVCRRCNMHLAPRLLRDRCYCGGEGESVEYVRADVHQGAVSTLEALEDALLRHFTGRIPEPEDDALMMAAQHRARARLRGQ